MSNVRWNCPDKNVHGGLNAPGRLRKIDIRRYCIPCSEKKGVLVERVQPAKETAAQKAARAKKEAEEARIAARIEENRLALEAKAMEPGKLTDLDADDLRNVLGGVTFHFAPPVRRGRWRGTVLTVLGTIVDVTSKTWRVRREDTGDVVTVSVRPSERRGWVKTRPFKIGGWSLRGTDVGGYDVFVSPTSEAPAAVAPRDT